MTLMELKMKKIFAIAWKDAIIRFTGSSELIFFIILPIIFTYLLAGGNPSADDDNRVRLVGVDQANTPVSQEIIAELDKSTAFGPDKLTLDKAEEQFSQRRSSAMLIIP